MVDTRENGRGWGSGLFSLPQLVHFTKQNKMLLEGGYVFTPAPWSLLRGRRRIVVFSPLLVRIVVHRLEPHNHSPGYHNPMNPGSTPGIMTASLSMQVPGKKMNYLQQMGKSEQGEYGDGEYQPGRGNLMTRLVCQEPLACLHKTGLISPFEDKAASGAFGAVLLATTGSDKRTRF